ncbi:MAG: NAD(P)H-binding protein [Gordonia sp. (in: high G+C Gram-positive bacteria)]|uniref:NAD-dependent epimerase/dehydratase family protein n=1 Tax=Gordonia sp. (in: high G+C Gram-positive bacteria) TaxID=84139 RepID=UPI0039E6D5ED
MTPVKVMVAGATSVIGLPVTKQLLQAGHDVVGLTRDPQRAALVEAGGARSRIVDVLDRDATVHAVRDECPDVVLSLLITLPRYGPRRLRDFAPSMALWRTGVPNLIAGAHAAGARRFVAESMIFAYGYRRFPQTLTEDDLYPGPPPSGIGGAEMLDALRRMETGVLEFGDSNHQGIVLRYGIFHGGGVPHSGYMTSLAKLWLMPVPTGGGVLSWIELGDAVDATVAAALSDTANGVYNVVDDEPVSFRDYMDSLAASLRRPRPLPFPRSVLGLAAPYAAQAFGGVELRVANDRAKRDLDWRLRYPNKDALFAGGLDG